MVITIGTGIIVSGAEKSISILLSPIVYTHVHTYIYTYIYTCIYMYVHVLLMLAHSEWVKLNLLAM